MGSSKLDRMCEVESLEGSYYILRKADKHARVVPVDEPNHEGIIVSVEEILNERRVETPPAVRQSQ